MLAIEQLSRSKYYVCFRKARALPMILMGPIMLALAGCGGAMADAAVTALVEQVSSAISKAGGGVQVAGSATITVPGVSESTSNGTGSGSGAGAGSMTTPIPVNFPSGQAISLGTSSADISAVRLANQATFGATDALVSEIKTKGEMQWILDQFNLPASRYSSTEKTQIHTTTNYTGNYCVELAGKVNFNDCTRDWYSSEPVKLDFFVQATTGLDQLRMRTAHLLSQIFVVSNTNVNGTDLNGTYGLARFQQSLRDQAFGNYKDLLRSVTLSPVMATYLNLVNNSKTDPNENYARELLQLFSVGTCMLNADGTLVSGECKPVYNNDMVRQYAFALSGWTYPAGGVKLPGISAPTWANPTNFAGLMSAVPAQHDQTQRSLLSGVSVPSGSTPQQALEAVLDSIMKHQNTGPFVALRFIRNFVTSNPSPQYVARVTNAFNSGKYKTIGSGVQGDLSATIAAVLLDDEARNLNTAQQASFGRLREPVLLMTGVIRALNGVTDGQYLGVRHYGSTLEQPIFNSPTVFNYYFLDGMLGGKADVAAPEFSITNSNATAARVNFVQDLLYSWNTAPNGGLVAQPGQTGAVGTYLNLGSFYQAASNPVTLVDKLDVLLTAGQLSSADRAAIVSSLPSIADQKLLSDSQKADMIRLAVFAITTSPQFQIQR
jgi:uncharacterized protein (DUF1800 family)